MNIAMVTRIQCFININTLWITCETHTHTHIHTHIYTWRHRNTQPHIQTHTYTDRQTHYNLEIFNANKFSRLPNPQKSITAKTDRQWILLYAFHYLTFSLAQLVHVVIYLLIPYGLLGYFKQNSCDGNLPNFTGPLPVFHQVLPIRQLLATYAFLFW